MHKIAIIQARMGSTRFPGKVLQMLEDKPVLKWVVDACFKISGIDRVVVATTDSVVDDVIEIFCNNNKVDCFRGSELDVLARHYYAARKYEADIILRITADCPLLDPYIASQVLWLVSSGEADYASNVMPASWPDGLDCEAFSMKILEDAHIHACRLSDREHVTPYMLNNQYKYRAVNVTSPIPNLHIHRWTIDTKEDFEFIKTLVKHATKDATTYDYLKILKNNPKIKQALNKRNEGLDSTIKKENVRYANFENSKKLLNDSLKTIPLGCQTFSKSYIQYPKNSSPFFLTHGKGSTVWDVDGNEYVDLVSGLLCIVLGYNDPDVNNAIQRQLTKGISFSLATELEIVLSEKLCAIIPSAQKVRFAKNGTDVTSAAIRLARAYTGRDKIISCGYHGWQDWYIGATTRNKGVPKSVSELTSLVPYNDLNKVETLLKDESYACMILEPCNTIIPAPGYLEGLKVLCEKYGSLLIFDEIVTGFRFTMGGAQQYFSVTPHLSCFGKAMGNGMPISAIVGNNDVMKEMEEIFFSGTFGGEALSLAASLATIEKIEKNNVIEHLWSYGQDLSQQIETLIAKHGLIPVLKLAGYAPWKILQFSDYSNETSFCIKTFFIQEMIRRGILINSSLNISAAHNDLDKNKILRAFDEVLFLMSDYLNSATLKTKLESSTIKPVFTLR